MLLRALFPEGLYTKLFRDDHQLSEADINKSAQDLAQSDEVYAVPYEFIGRNIASVNLQHGNNFISNDYAKHYPDWFRLTPAYSLNFAGRSKTQLAADLFRSESGNNLFERLKRWYDEPQTVVYCDRMDKLTTIFKVIMMLLTLTILVWQYKVGAESRYVIPSLLAKSEADMSDEEKKMKSRADTLSKVASHPIWQVALMICTAIPMVVTAINVFKRTTLPAKRTRITNFTNGNAVANQTDRRRQTIRFDMEKSVYDTIRMPEAPDQSIWAKAQSIFQPKLKMNRVHVVPSRGEHGPLDFTN